MDGAINPASIALSISIGASLLAGWFSVRVAMPSRQGATVNRDTAVSILFAVAVLLMVLITIASALIAVAGMAYVGLLKAALLLTAAFAVVGLLFGLVRGPRSGTASHSPR